MKILDLASSTEFLSSVDQGRPCTYLSGQLLDLSLGREVSINDLLMIELGPGHDPLDAELLMIVRHVDVPEVVTVQVALSTSGHIPEEPARDGLLWRKVCFQVLRHEMITVTLG